MKTQDNAFTGRIVIGGGILRRGILLLMVVGLLVAGARADDISRLREQQQRELDRIEKKYNDYARKKYGNKDGSVRSDDPKYKQLEKTYEYELEAVRKKYQKLDPRLAEIETIKENYKGQIDISGSDPKDVRSDVDLTAKTDEAAKKLAQQWKDAGHKVISDPKTGKYYNKTTDTTLWEPSTPERAKARAQDPDAFETMGGKKAAGVTGKEAMSDAWGNQVDNQKKFDDARSRGDYKTQGKSVSKAAQNVGHKSDVTRQADALRNYQNTDEAGITKLGETSEVKQQKKKQWQQDAQKELKVTEQKAVQKSQRQKEIRQKLADQAEKTAKNTLDPENKGTADNIRKRSENLEKNNAEIRRKKQAETSSEPKKPDSPDDSGSKNAKNEPKTAEKTQKTDAEGAKTRKTGDFEQNSPKNAENSDFSTKTDAKTQETVKKPQKTAAQPDEFKTTKKTEIEAPETRKIQKIPETDLPDTAKKAKIPETELPETQKAPRTGDVDAPGTRKTHVPDADVPSKPRTTGGVDTPSTGSKVMGALDAAGDTLDAVEKAETYVEGAVEGDPSKMSSVIVGQDTAERTRGKNAQKWADEENKAQEARGDEVRQELKAKLRRKGASEAEAEAAMQKRDAGDHKGFRDDVQKIKAKDIADTKQRGLTPDGSLQEEDGLGERLKEGAKQAGSYADAATGGVAGRKQESDRQSDELNKEHDKTISTMKQEIDNELIKKMMRKGVSYDDAREAVDKKNEGDRTMFNDLRKKIQGTEDAGQSGSGLDADGRIADYDYGDYGEDAVDNTKTGASNIKKKFVELGEKPGEIYKKHQDNKIDQATREKTGTQGEEVRDKLIKMGVDPTEAEKAGNDFSDGNYDTAKDLIKEQKQKHADDLVNKHGADPEDAQKAADAWVRGDRKESYDLRKRLTQERQEKSTRSETEDKQKDNDLTGDDDGWADDDGPWKSGAPGETSVSSNPLRESEASSGEDGDFDWDAGTGNDLLDHMIRQKEKEKFDFAERSIGLNQQQQDINNASVSGDGLIASSKQQVDSAQLDADGVREQAINQVVATDREESWGSAVGDGMVDGITSGAASIGAAIASGINASVYGDKDKDDGGSSGDAGGEETVAEGDAGGDVQTAAAAPADGGGAPAPAAAESGAPAPAPAAPQAASAGKTKPASSAKAASSSSPSGPIYCPKCGGTKFGPREKIYGPNGQTGSDRRCLTCGHMGGVYGKPPASLTKKNTKKKTSGATTCPRCGAVIARPSSNTPLCTRCCSIVACDHTMQRAAEKKGQKRVSKEEQWYGVCPGCH